MITIIMCHSPNRNSNLPRFFKSLESMTSDIKNIEVCIKTDELIEFPKTEIVIKTLVTPQRRGYADLHLGYKDLRDLVSGKVVVAVADDFECVVKDWDIDILKTADIFNDKGVFIIFGEKYDFPFPINNLSYAQVDPSPMWSKRLLDLCDWDYGCFATDIWSYILCHYMNAEGIDLSLRYKKVFHRHTDLSIDSSSSPRWHNERQTMIDLVSGEGYQNKIKSQVSKIRSHYVGI